MSEQQEAQSREWESEEHHSPRAEPVDQNAFQRSDQSAFQAGEGDSAGDCGAGPAELCGKRDEKEGKAVRGGCAA